MKTSTAILAVSDSPSINLPSSGSTAFVEWSILAGLAVFLVREGWKHFSTTDQKDRDADRALMQTLIEDLRLGNQQRALEQRQTTKELQQEVIELKGLIAACLVKLTGESVSEILKRKD
ncbi:hypothetical protein NDI44_08650 [Trichocoleus sp. DQ-A3]|uniref:hypothetical protein n=1 Tax=Cyanophyceae TaxID=3028117 RepID=UPI0016880970|nr:hypothetical protein [Coleofasciculus sp. FACHB-125]MBD1899260.1 hypothetical protein [Coleofasciculus sp. FACHB-125]